MKSTSSVFEIPIAASALLDALEREEIIPNMLLAFLVLSILPGTRVLGGSRQVIYYPLMQHVLLKTLAQSTAYADHELANAISRDTLPGVWGHRTIAPICLDPWRLVAETGPAATSELLDHLGKQPLVEAAGALPGFTTDPLWLTVARQR